MGDVEDLLELAQAAPVLIKDGRTGSAAKIWLTDFITRRWIRDDAEAVTIQTRLGLAGNYPTNPLPVVSYTLVQRIPLVGDDPG